MKSIFSILSFLLAGSAFGQNEGTQLEIEDFNKDGSADTLTTFRDSGSGFGSISCSMVNGRTGEVHEWGVWGSFGEIRQTLAIPPSLAKTENEAFLLRMKEEILPPIRDKADPSLNWLITANRSQIVLASDTTYNLVLFPSSTWIKGTPESPANYCLKLDPSDFADLYHIEEEKPDWYDEKRTAGYLSYAGMNHSNFRRFSWESVQTDSSEFIPVQSNANYAISKTSHGIIVQKGDSYKWIFVNDMVLTSGPEKLRWSSIGDVALFDHFIVFQHLLAPYPTNQFFIIDLESGVCGRLKEMGNNFKLEGNGLIIQGNYPEDSISLEVQTLLDELSNLNARK